MKARPRGKNPSRSALASAPGRGQGRSSSQATGQSEESFSATDKLDLHESIVRLANAYTDGDVPAFRDLFAEDVVAEFAWSGVISTRIEGREALATWLSDLFNLYWTVKCSRVWTGNVLVSGCGDTATTSCLFNRLSLQGQSISTGTWDLLHGRTGSRWQITGWRISVDDSREELAAKRALAIAQAHSIGR